MTTAVVSQIATHTNDATFRAWGLAMSSLLASAGLVQTADTGQIDWATATRPVVNSTDAGYEIWRFDDTLQATVPIFIKIRYGTANNTYNNLRIQMDLGDGSDGAGTLTGFTQSTAIDLGYTSNSTQVASTAQPMLASHDEGYFTFAWNPSGDTNVALGMCIERLRDVAGAPDARGYWVYACNKTITASNQYYVYLASVGFTTGTGFPILTPAYYTNSSYSMMPNNGSLVNGGIAYACPWRPRSGDNTHGLFEQTLGGVAVGTYDFPTGSYFTLERWDGQVHRYRRVLIPYVSNIAGSTGTLAIGLLADA